MIINNRILPITIYTTCIIILYTYLSSLVSDTTHYIGLHYTDSAFNTPSCIRNLKRCNIKWDKNIQVTMYLLYALAYLILIFTIHLTKSYLYSSRVLVNVSKYLMILFFPTICFFVVDCMQDTFPGTRCDQPTFFVGPLILTLNPLAWLISFYPARYFANYILKEKNKPIKRN